MVSEPECRYLGIPGRARYSVDEAKFLGYSPGYFVNQGGTASILVALGFPKGDFFIFQEDQHYVQRMQG